MVNGLSLSKDFVSRLLGSKKGLCRTSGCFLPFEVSKRNPFSEIDQIVLIGRVRVMNNQLEGRCKPAVQDPETLAYQSMLQLVTLPTGSSQSGIREEKRKRNFKCSSKVNRELINRPGKDGRTMLWTAVDGERTPMIQTLLNNGADVNIPDKSGKTLLQYLCRQDKIDVDLIKLITKEVLIARRLYDCEKRDNGLEDVKDMMISEKL